MKNILITKSKDFSLVINGLKVLARTLVQQCIYLLFISRNAYKLSRGGKIVQEHFYSILLRRKPFTLSSEPFEILQVPLPLPYSQRYVTNRVFLNIVNMLHFVG